MCYCEWFHFHFYLLFYFFFFTLWPFRPVYTCSQCCLFVLADAFIIIIISDVKKTKFWSWCILQDHYDDERDSTTPDRSVQDQDQDQFFGLTSLVLRPTVSDHITDHHHHHRRRHLIMTPPPRLGIKRWCCLTSVCLTSVAYIRPKSRTGMPRKTKIGTEIAHFTRDADTTLRSKGQRSQGRGYIVAASRTACSFIKCNIKSHNEQLTNRTCKARWELSHSPELQLQYCMR